MNNRHQEGKRGPYTHAVGAILAAAIVASGCVSPIRMSEIDDPSLRKLQGAFSNVVAQARDDPEYSWHSGILGNMWVIVLGQKNVGLCYHWQEWVYQEIRPALDRMGGGTCGIAIHMRELHEHHAVAVYDPRLIGRKELLAASTESPVFVFDAWHRGQADIYPLTDWLTMEKATASAEVENLPLPEDHFQFLGYHPFSNVGATAVESR